MRWTLGRRPALDGLRGVAVLLVLATHFDNGQVTLGGVIGVKVFFTLSGFLITALLLEEHSRTGRVSIPAFYERRARRLLPALAVVVAIVSLLGVAGLPLGLRPAMVGAILLYGSNWYLLAAAHGGQVPWGALGHTWSLAIEEQFYLVWPPLMILALQRGRRGVLVLASTLAVLSLAWSLVSGRPALATDVSAWCLLAGCVLAAMTVGGPVRRVPWWPSLLVLAAVPLAFTSWSSLAHVAAPLVTVAAIWVAVQRPIGWLEVRWLRWVGVRSYGLYLWHVPVAYLGEHVLGPPWWAVSAVGVAVSFGLCAASWRWVETPFLHKRGVGGDARGGERPGGAAGDAVDRGLVHGSGERLVGS